MIAWRKDYVEQAFLGVHELDFELESFFGPDFIESFGEWRALEPFVVGDEHWYGNAVGAQFVNRVGEGLVADVVMVVFDEHKADAGILDIRGSDVFRVEGFDSLFDSGCFFGRANALDEHSKCLPGRFSSSVAGTGADQEYAE